MAGEGRGDMRSGGWKARERCGVEVWAGRRGSGVGWDGVRLWVRDWGLRYGIGEWLMVWKRSTRVTSRGYRGHLIQILDL